MPAYSHGHSRGARGRGVSPTYRSWQLMLQRLTNPANPAYAGFKTLGITCDSRGVEFKSFLADMGPRAPGRVLRRHDINRGFCKENCYWGPHPIPQPFNSVTAKLANRISRKLAPSKGRRSRGRPKSMRSIRAQAIAHNIDPNLVYERIRAGFSKYNELNVPAAKKNKRRAILLDGETRPDPDRIGGGPPPPGAQGSAGFGKVGSAPEATGRARALVGREQGEATQAAVILGEPELDLSEIETLSEGKTRMVVWLSLKFDLGIRTCKRLLEKFEWNLSAVLEDMEQKDETKAELDPTGQDSVGAETGESGQVFAQGRRGDCPDGVAEDLGDRDHGPVVPGSGTDTATAAVRPETRS